MVIRKILPQPCFWLRRYQDVGRMTTARTSGRLGPAANQEGNTVTVTSCLRRVQDENVFFIPLID
jgi:hypothetical protein